MFKLKSKKSFKRFVKKQPKNERELWEPCYLCNKPVYSAPKFKPDVELGIYICDGCRERITPKEHYYIQYLYHTKEDDKKRWWAIEYFYQGLVARWEWETHQIKAGESFYGKGERNIHHISIADIVDFKASVKQIIEELEK